ncbi:Nuclease-related domain-containing protein [Pelagirhabdus alkalitolerans]|uniref:Nuclease-related domain-containing protein n=1 Tax=Pelagirhabdus alkalitolerans TaxID=1612202 RepID=A0A1G6GH42_9BACI|nr:nuclease-related domain-containing protein [Pelagirhabdus alkalitolerans]SDB81209.1 Nuclease-related domain-containing protein [Pelagirhabdus alkalitolerans]
MIDERLPLTEPSSLRHYEALLRRLPRSHPHYEQVLNTEGRERAGYFGEKEFLYYLNFVKQEPIFSLAGLRLLHDEHYFQIDHLLITPQLCLIIEIKHLTGTITFNDSNQMIQTTDHERIYTHPKLQANLQAKQLQHVLAHLGYQLPIQTLVVFTHRQGKLITQHPGLVTAPSFIHKYEEIIARYPTVLSESECSWLADQLSSRHMDRAINVMEKFKIREADLLKGVLCPDCAGQQMMRKHGAWYCPRCKSVDKRAHVQALKDYQILISDTISCREACEYLGVESRHVTRRLLLFAGCELIGDNRSAHYKIR